jgi:tetratricopeptide (TPR) repeat protein
MLNVTNYVTAPIRRLLRIAASAGASTAWRRFGATWIGVLGIAWAGTVLAGTSEQGQGLPRPLYETLERAQQLLQDEHPQQALQLLKRAKRQARGDYARAVVWQTFGYVQLELERLADAARSFETALELDALPAASRDNLRWNLARVLARLGRQRRAIELLEDWLSRAAEPSLRPRLLLARLYIEVERYAEVPPLLKGLARRLPEPKDKERVYRLLVVAYTELGRYRAAIAPLKALVSWLPQRREYWLRLADGYLSLGRETDALAVLEAAYLQGRLQRSGELRSLARLYLRRGIPYKAGVLLERALAAGRLEPNPDNLRLLAQSWRLARERDKAIAALERLLDLAPDADRARELAYLYLEGDSAEQAIRVLEQALRRSAENGDSQARDELWMLLGLAYVRRGQPEQGREAFSRIDAGSRLGPQARRWLDYLEYLRDSVVSGLGTAASKVCGTGEAVSPPLATARAGWQLFDLLLPPVALRRHFHEPQQYLALTGG